MQAVTEDPDEIAKQLKFYGEAFTWKGYLMEACNKELSQLLMSKDTLEGMMLAYEVVKGSTYFPWLKNLDQKQQKLVSDLEAFAKEMLTTTAHKVEEALDKTQWKEELGESDTIPFATLHKQATVIIKGAAAQCLAESFKALKQDQSSPMSPNSILKCGWRPA